MQPNDTETKMTAVATIAAAFFSHNHSSVADIGNVIQAITAGVDSILGGASTAPPAPEVRAEPAVSIRKSITPDFMICLEDGRKFKSLKRHLRTAYNMAPEDYRTKWGLPREYPMVAPNYAKSRSDLAKSMGLGRISAKVAAATVPAPRQPKEGKAAKRAGVAA